MYIHIGQETVVSSKNIIGIFDPDTSTVSIRTRQSLAVMEKNGEVQAVFEDIPKAFVLCTEGKTGKSALYLSPVSVQTLGRRLEEARVYNPGNRKV